jgi:hypothetical protein
MYLEFRQQIMAFIFMKRLLFLLVRIHGLALHRHHQYSTLGGKTATQRKIAATLEYA